MEFGGSARGALLSFFRAFLSSSLRDRRVRERVDDEDDVYHKSGRGRKLATFASFCTLLRISTRRRERVKSCSVGCGMGAKGGREVSPLFLA